MLALQMFAKNELASTMMRNNAWYSACLTTTLDMNVVRVCNEAGMQ